MISLFLAITMLQADTPRTVSFSYRAAEQHRSVVVVGQFNGWDRAANPLVLGRDGLTWQGAATIPPGAYQYLFCLDGSKWVRDPSAPGVNDTNGNVNSLLVVTPASYDRYPGKAGDGVITASALLHRPTRQDAARLTRSSAWVRLRTRVHDIQAVNVMSGGKTYPMKVVASDELYDFWQGQIEIAPKGRTSYRFELVDGPTTLWFGPSGISGAGSFSQDFAAWPLPKPVDWAKDAVFYQIFPDRFFNGDPTNDPPDVEPWGAKPTGRNRMGGDLKGITKKLGHLKDLGVDAIYLNPIFEAGANHGYDTYDYHKVDHRFGTNEDLKALVSKSHAQGTRVILDAVFNHSGTEFFAFKDLVSNGERSRYKDWYFPLAYPLVVKEGQRTYRTFSGVQSMPKLNGDNPETADYLLGVATGWIKDAGIDGWRLDVADEVSQDFWRKFRRAVRRAKPETFIVGENFGDAHEWLQGDEHDSVMNYRWRQATLSFFSGKTASARDFESELARIRGDYPPATLLTMFNLLSSHDTERIKTVMKNQMERVKLAVAFQFTYPGTPSIYYGDEIGMEGGKDPDERRCMIWEKAKWDRSLFALHKELIGLRKRLPALRRGSYSAIASLPKNVFGFERRFGGQRVDVYLNRSREPYDLALRGRKVEMLLGHSHRDQGLKVGAWGFAVLSK